jgi:hypothetical protein
MGEGGPVRFNETGNSCTDQDCDWSAIEDPGDRFGDGLCEFHLNEAYAQDDADNSVKAAKEAND